MNKKKTAEPDPKFVIKKRERKPQQSFENLTPFRHPLADVFDFPSPSLTAPVNNVEGSGDTNQITGDNMSGYQALKFESKDATDNQAGNEQYNDFVSNKDNDEEFNPLPPSVLQVPIVPKVVDVPIVPKVEFAINQSPIAPVKNFHRVSNTINREALEGGLFTRPSCKQVYDALYLLTRGAIQATRTVQIGRKTLLKKAGIGSDKTLDAAISSLQTVGLLHVNNIFGSQKGNIYEVILPEEITPDLINAATASTLGTHSTPPQILPSVHKVENTHSTKSQTIENATIYGNPKTIFKTNKEENDDERCRAAFGEMIKILDQGIENLIGRKTTVSDQDKWKNVAEILLVQLELINSRTAISNAPAILAEHLHRHLNNKRVQEKLGLTTPAQARETKETKQPFKEKEVVPDLYLCPDCFGTGMYDPDGKGRRPGCQHPGLAEARQRAKDDGEI